MAGVQGRPPESLDRTGSAGREPAADIAAVAVTERASRLRRAIAETAKFPTAPLPAWQQPAIAQRAATPPIGDDWLHEASLPGLRILAWLERGSVRLRPGSGQDWTARLPGLAEAIAQLPTGAVLLDGEVGLPGGASSLSALHQAVVQRRTGALVYRVFDLMHVDGYDLRRVALERRKVLLRELLCGEQDPRLCAVDHVVGRVQQLFHRCRERGWNGVVSRRRGGAYPSGSTDEWRKTICVWSDPFVIGGYTRIPGESRVPSRWVTTTRGVASSMRAGRRASTLSCRNCWNAA